MEYSEVTFLLGKKSTFMIYDLIISTLPSHTQRKGDYDLKTNPWKGDFP